MWIEKINLFILHLLKQNDDRLILMGLEFVEHSFESIEICLEIRDELFRKIYSDKMKIKKKINILSALFDFKVKK